MAGGLEQDGLGVHLYVVRRLLTLQYAARLSPRQARFRWPSSEELIAVQDGLSADLGLDQDEEDTAYDRGFLKELVGRLEEHVAARDEDDLEVNGDLLERYATLMAVNSSCGVAAQPSSRLVTHFFPNFDRRHARKESDQSYAKVLPGWRSLCMVEEGTTIARGTTGLKTWEASLRLGGYLVTNPGLLDASQQTVLELGCGTGFLGVMAASLRASEQTRIVMTDLDGQVLEKAKQTVESNVDRCFTDANVELAPLDWIDVQHGQQEACCWLDNVQATLILAADIVFDPALVAPLCSVLKRALCSPISPAPVALVSSTVRNEATFAFFVSTLVQHCLSVEEVPLPTPMIDLHALELVHGMDTPANHLLPLFPSTHDPITDGYVKLLRITAASRRS